jgi:hypothetical protein
MGQDMTSSFLGALEKFCLAEAQECFWQRAVLEKYKNGLIAKLAIQVGLSAGRDEAGLMQRCFVFAVGFGILRSRLDSSGGRAQSNRTLLSRRKHSAS